MFEEYLEDAHAFFQMAVSTADEQEARRYFRVSVLCTAGAIEAFVNYLADGFEKAATLPEYEVAFLNDKVLFFDVNNARKTSKAEFHRLEDKLRVLLKRFKPDVDLGREASWSKVLEFKKLRDGLTHPRQIEDTLPVVEYKRQIKAGLSGIIGLMNILSLSIYKRPLRAKLLDLIPD